MKNFKSLICVLTLFLIYTNPANAQSSVNSLSLPEKNYRFVETLPVSEPRFLEDIEFTSTGFEAPQVSISNSLLAGQGFGVESASPEIIENANGLQFKYALMMDVAVESIKRTSLYRFIDDWYGTRYRMGGITKKGIDCSAFTSCLLLSCYSLRIPRTAREQHAATTPVEKEELVEGDLVFFNTKGGVSHVGVYLSNNRFVHSSSSQGVVISSLDDSYYARRFIRGGRPLEESTCIDN